MTTTSAREGMGCNTIPIDIYCPCDGWLKPTAHNTGDGWTWGLECTVCGDWWGDESPEPPYPWPFDKETATANDWRALGVEIV